MFSTQRHTLLFLTVLLLYVENELFSMLLVSNREAVLYRYLCWPCWPVSLVGCLLGLLKKKKKMSMLSFSFHWLEARSLSCRLSVKLRDETLSKQTLQLWDCHVLTLPTYPSSDVLVSPSQYMLLGEMYLSCVPSGMGCHVCCLVAASCGKNSF